MSITSSRRRDVIAILMITLVFVSILGYIIQLRREHMRLAPPRGIDTFDEFQQHMGEPAWLVLVEKAGTQYIMWYGDLAGLFSLPSGRSCYIFDTAGNLVHWQSETGDGGLADRFDDTSALSKEISLDQAIALVEADKDRSADLEHE